MGCFVRGDIQVKRQDGSTSAFEELLKSLKEMNSKQSTLLIGIDGCGGAGKSTLASKIKETYSNATIVHHDDFYLPSGERINVLPNEKPIGADFDWRRLLHQVLDPITNNQGTRGALPTLRLEYRSFSRMADCAGWWHRHS